MPARSTECFLEAEIHRVRGELLLGRETPLEAEACLRRSMEIARHQKAKSLELRTAMVLAQHWQRQGRRQEAYDLVAPIFGWFTRGLRYARSAEGQGVAGRIGSPGTLKATSGPKANTARSLLLLPTRTAAETKYRRESIAGTWGQRPRHLGRHLPTV